MMDRAFVVEAAAGSAGNSLASSSLVEPWRPRYRLSTFASATPCPRRATAKNSSKPQHSFLRSSASPPVTLHARFSTVAVAGSVFPAHVFLPGHR